MWGMRGSQNLGIVKRHIDYFKILIILFFLYNRNEPDSYLVHEPRGDVDVCLRRSSELDTLGDVLLEAVKGAGMVSGDSHRTSRDTYSGRQALRSSSSSAES